MSRFSQCLVFGSAALTVLLVGSLQPFGAPATAAPQENLQHEKVVSQSGAEATAASGGEEIESFKKPASKFPASPPATVSGIVVDHLGKPVSRSVVEVDWVQRITTPNRNAIEVEVLQRWQVNTDESGKFTVDTSTIDKLERSQNLRVLSVTAPQLVLRRGVWLDAAEVVKGESFDVKLLEGRRITAHVVTSRGLPAAGAVVKAAGISADPNGSWWTEGILIDADGLLSLEVPVGMDTELLVHEEDHAPLRVAVGPTDSVLGKLALQPGIRVHGRVLDQQGEAISGTVVVLRTEGGNLDHLAFTTSFAVKTNDAGEFEMPPCLGECTLSVAEIGIDTSGLGRVVVRGDAPPVMLPVDIQLNGDEQSKPVDLQAGPTATIHGKATWENGEPVINMQVSAGAMMSTLGVDLSYTTTDEQGRYQLELPVPIADAYVNAFGHRDEEGEWHMAHGECDDAAMASGQFISFRPLDGEIQDANWKLKAYQRRPAPPVEHRNAEHALLELQEEEQEIRVTYRQALASGEMQQAYDELDPRNLMAAKYLALEQEHRGTPAALRALTNVMSQAQSVGDPMSAVAQARNQAVDRLFDHYLTLEELGPALDYLDSGPPTPRAEELLEAALASNPYRSVQVAALLAHVQLLRGKLRGLHQFETHQGQIAARLDQIPAQVRASFAKRIAEFEQLEPQTIRDQANAKLKRMAEEFGDEPLDYYGTAFNAAQDLSHALNNVIVGDIAPDLVATDIREKSFRLSEHRDEIVVLFFGQALFDNYEEGYEPIRAMIKQYEDQPVRLVGILSNHDQKHLMAAFDRGDLPWTIIPQTLNGPVQRKWGIDFYPTIYIVDQAGILHGGFAIPRFETGYDTSEIESHVDKMLEQ